MLHPTEVTGRPQSLHKPFAPLVEPLKVRWGQSTDGTPIPFLFKHPAGDFVSFQCQSFGCSLLVCVYVCVCVCREGVILVVFGITQFLALFFSLFIALLPH